MKKDRLLEIIREEIGAVLSEVGQSPEEAKATNLAIQAEKAKIAAAQKQLQQLQKTGVSEVTLEEDTLNEMAYDIIISQPNELAKLQDKIKDSTKKGEQKLAKALEIIQKTKKAGKPIRQRDIANEMGVIQQEINPLINKLIDVGILEKGESVTGVTKKKVTDKAQGRPTGEPKEKPASTGKKGRPAGAPKAEKVATRTPGDDGFDNVEYSDDEESAAATKAAGSDETAKELGNTPEEKKIKFNQFLTSVKKNKDDKAKIDGILKLAKDKFKFAKSMMDDLKRAAGREVEV
jgi:predicted transcriptional regulator